jgi:hypothetical protein
MSHSTSGLSVKGVPETGEDFIPGTVYAVVSAETDLLDKQAKNIIPSFDGVSILLNNFSSLQENHQAGREKYFQQGLPFYTCLNALENLWQKELPDGKVYQVILTFDWKNDKLIENQVKKIR